MYFGLIIEKIVDGRLIEIVVERVFIVERVLVGANLGHFPYSAIGNSVETLEKEKKVVRAIGDRWDPRAEYGVDEKRGWLHSLVAERNPV